MSYQPSGVLFRPTGEYILVERKKEDEKSAGGIYLPESTRERPNEGIIRALGTDVAEAYHFAVGQTILFGKYAGTEVMIDGLEYTLIKAEEVYGVRPE